MMSQTESSKEQKGPKAFLPVAMLDKRIGELTITQTDDDWLLHITFLLDLKQQYGSCQTGLALDGSESMIDAYGRMAEGAFPPFLKSYYSSKGRAWISVGDGVACVAYDEDLLDKAISFGFFRYYDNVVEPEAQRLCSYLAQLDEDTKTHAIYWACNTSKTIETIGDFSAVDGQQHEYDGPKNEMGEETRLVPALKHFDQRYPDADFGFYVFVTDGFIDDFDEVVEYTKQLCKNINQGKQKPRKLILIGVGTVVNNKQLQMLDDLNQQTGVDLWDYHHAESVDSLMDVFSELTLFQDTIATTGNIQNADQEEIVSYPDGVPYSLNIRVPPDTKTIYIQLDDDVLEQKLPKDPFFVPKKLKYEEPPLSVARWIRKHEPILRPFLWSFGKRLVGFLVFLGISIKVLLNVSESWFYGLGVVFAFIGAFLLLQISTGSSPEELEAPFDPFQK